MTMNRFIAEKVMGVCWHEIPEIYPPGKCRKCGGNFTAIHVSDWNPALFNPDYSTGKDKAALMDKCVGEEWWESFYKWAWFKVYAVPGQKNADSFVGDWNFYAYLWRNLPELVAEYRGYKCP